MYVHAQAYGPIKDRFGPDVAGDPRDYGPIQRAQNIAVRVADPKSNIRAGLWKRFGHELLTRASGGEGTSSLARRCWRNYVIDEMPKGFAAIHASIPKDLLVRIYLNRIVG